MKSCLIHGTELYILSKNSFGLCCVVSKKNFFEKSARVDLKNKINGSRFHSQLKKAGAVGGNSKKKKKIFSCLI